MNANSPDHDPDIPRSPSFDPDEWQPAPDWDYAQTWHHAIALRREADSLLAAMQEEKAEHRNQSTDQAVRDRLRQISAQIREIMALLD